jgi:hypothetical protein
MPQFKAIFVSAIGCPHRHFAHASLALPTHQSSEFWMPELLEILSARIDRQNPISPIHGVRSSFFR